MNTLNKEQIKDRLVRMAARQWNLNENEIDGNFDPLVALLFDALSSELEGIGYQIKEIQSGLMDEFASVMMPLTMLQSQPAHCVVTSTPIEDSAIITDKYSFQTNIKIRRGNTQDREDTTVNFMPLGDVRLIKTGLKYLKTGNNIYDTTGLKGKKISEGKQVQTIQTIEFAISNDAKITDLSGMQFFFDLKGHSEATNIYNAIHEADLYINDQPIDWHNGYYKNEQYSTALQDVMNDFNYGVKVKKSVAAIYRPQFMTIQSKNNLPHNNISADSFWQDVSEDIRKKATEMPLIYGRIHLKRPFAADVYERLSVAINALPLINQSEISVVSKTNKWVNIIPLPVKNCFLSLSSIKDVEGNSFKYRLGQSDKNLNAGEAILRTSQVGKTGSKDLRKTIQNLLDAIRDQSAYFSHVSNDFVTSRLQEIAKILTRLEDKLYISNDIQPTHYYVLLKPNHIGNNVEVVYTVTDGNNALEVKSGAVFTPFKHTLTGLSNTIAITNAVGAVEHLTHYASQQYLLRQLSSKGKIISVEDIRYLCFQIMGDLADRVDVNRVMKVMQQTKQGIERVTQIEIVLKNTTLADEELYYLKQRILNELEKDAAFVYPFEVLFKKQ